MKKIKIYKNKTTKRLLSEMKRILYTQYEFQNKEIKNLYIVALYNAITGEHLTIKTKKCKECGKEYITIPEDTMKLLKKTIIP